MTPFPENALSGLRPAPMALLTPFRLRPERLSDRTAALSLASRGTEPGADAPTGTRP